MKINVPLTFDVDIDMIVDWFQSCDWYEDDLDKCIADYIDQYIYEQITLYLDVAFDCENIDENIEKKIKKAVEERLAENKGGFNYETC